MSIERLRESNSDEYNEEDEEIELEIVEVEELDEPVPTQDSCLQVDYFNEQCDVIQMMVWIIFSLVYTLRTYVLLRDINF